MSAETEPKTKRAPGWMRGFALFMFAAWVAILGQWYAGGFRSDFNGHPEEAAHVLTGLEMRDYLAARPPGGPSAYWAQYAAHYPRIVIHHWPESFSLAQAVWTLPFGASRLTLLQMMAILAAGLAALIVRAFPAEEKAVGLALALSFLLLPLARESYSLVMPDMLCALLVFGSAMAFARFLDRERARDALLFGGLAGLAILIEASGVALFLMAPLAILISRRWSVLKQPALWGGVVLAALLAAPSVRYFVNAMNSGGHPTGLPWNFELEASFWQCVNGLGPIVVALMLVGVVFLGCRRQFHLGRWAVCAALVLAAPLFRSIVPTGLESLTALPPALVLCGAAYPRVRRPWLAGLLLLAFVTSAATVPPARFKDARGFGSLAEWFVHQAQPADKILVSSDDPGAETLVAEVALRDPHRPSFTVQPAGAMLSGDGSTLDVEMGWLFTKGAYRFLVLDLDVPQEDRQPYMAVLETYLDSHRDQFERLSTWPSHRDGHPGMLVLYRSREPAAKN